MRAQEVGSLVGTAGRVLREPAHGAEEARRRMRIEPRFAGDHDAFLVGRQLLRLAEGGERQLRLVGRLVGRGIAAEHPAHHLVDQRRGADAVGARLRVLEDDVRDLVRQHRRQLALVVGQRQDAARHVDVAAGQREGVDDGAVEDGDGEFGVGLVGRRQQFADDLRQHDLGRPVGVDAAIGSDDPGIFACPDDVVLGIARVGDERRQRAGARRHRGARTEHARAAGEDREGSQDQQAGHGARAHGTASTSICSGCVMATRGPSLRSIQPRTRTSAPPSLSGSSPSSLNRRNAFASITAVKSSL